MTRLISGIYNSIYTPTEEILEARKPTRRSAHGRKVDRELETTLRQIKRPRRKKKPLTARGRESHRLQQARWAKENPDCVSEAQKKWREKNPGYHAQWQRDKYAEDPERYRKRRREYYARKKAI